MAVVTNYDLVLGCLCFFCGHTILTLPCVLINGEGYRLVLHPVCGSKLKNLLVNDLILLRNTPISLCKPAC